MIFDDTICELGEGPLWHPERKQLFWFDILGKALHTKGQTWAFDQCVSAAGWIDRDTLMIASATSLSTFDLTTGTGDVVVPLEAENPLTRSNDGRADPCGGFWIGTMGMDAEPGAGSIYRYYRGEVRKILKNISVTNAICFHPDGGSACFTDTPTKQVMRVALDKDGWPIGDPWVHIDTTGTNYNPDGAVFDQAGNIWVANWGESRVAGYDGDGKEFDSFAVPAVQASCPAFGGEDLTTLFVTSAAIGCDGVDDGKTFVLETSYAGQAEHRVIL